MPSNALDSPMKFQHLAISIVPHVIFLCARPIQWYVVLLVGTQSQFPGARALSADSLGDIADLLVCGRDSTARVLLFDSFVSLSFERVSLPTPAGKRRLDDGLHYWILPLSGAGGLPLPCPVWYAVFQNLDQSNLQKIRVAVNSLFGEVQAWLRTSITGGTGEVDSYVKYNVQLNVWDHGMLGRTAWVDQSVLGGCLLVYPATLLLYQGHV